MTGPRSTEARHVWASTEAGADSGAIAIEVRALSREPDHRVPELLVVLDDRAVGATRRVRAVLHADVAGRNDRSREAAVREVELRQERERLTLQSSQIGG